MKKLTYSILLSFFLLNVVCSAQILKIEDFSLKMNGENEMISLKKNGEIIVNNQVAGKLSADGKVKNLEGKIVAAIDKQGKAADGEKTIGLIDKKGEIDFGSGKRTGWSKDGKFKISDENFLSISPNKPKFYRTASFLILLNYFVKQTSSATVETSLNPQFNYKETDVVASIAADSGGRYPVDYSLIVYGDGTIVYTNSNFHGIGNKVKTTKAKIDVLRQKADELTFPKPQTTAAAPFVHDALSYTMQIWHKGDLKRISWSTGTELPQELSDFYDFLNKFFEPEISAANKSKIGR